MSEETGALAIEVSSASRYYTWAKPLFGLSMT